MQIQNKIKKSYKGLEDHNPVLLTRFGADPYTLVYKDRVYIYMTEDKPEYDADGNIEENTYSVIDTLSVVSSDDLVNWQDHGIIHAAGKSGAASWGNNSWAPAAAYKNIDGKDRFFLYFANSGNGIAVLTSDSPTGPFVDPIGKALISRDTPTCADVTWLFDPAILMDDDGSAYIYFGGGVPSPDKASNPGTARVAKLGADMVSLDGDPKVIENVPYLFEDAGINKIDGTYYYSYCTNFDVTEEGTKKYGFEKGEIMTMCSDDPMGPFELCNPVLKNPANFFGMGGNNHHCMFEFKNQWYIAYHTRILEREMGFKKGYRNTNIDRLNLNDKSQPTTSTGTSKGVAQVKNLDPYKENLATVTSNLAGVNTKPFEEKAREHGCGEMIISDISDGSWIMVSGADFGDTHPVEFSVKAQGSGEGTVHVLLDTLQEDEACSLSVNCREGRLESFSTEDISKIQGKHDIFFVFEGEGYEVYSWKFTANK